MRVRHPILVQQLKELPQLVQKAELEYYDAQKIFMEIKQQIVETEVKLFKEGKVDNKNEFTRTASFLKHTEKLHRDRIIAEYEMNNKKSDFYKLKHEMENARIIAKLLTNEE